MVMTIQIRCLNTMLEYYAEETLHNVNNIKWLQQMDYIDRGGHAW